MYLMKDAQGKVIYVGKSNELKGRIAQYFTGQDARPMAPFLMARVDDIDWIATATPKEALILENNLIKKYRPRYNVYFRDDKTYYHLSVDLSEEFPRLQLVRQRTNPKALYFGPYPSGLAAKEALRFVKKVFPLRSCSDRAFPLRSRPCLEYQIGRCLAPCKGVIDQAAYRKLIQEAVSFLQGRRRQLVVDLKKQMEEAADTLNFEEAARLRDRIAALEHVLEKQNVDGAGHEDQDVMGVFAEGEVYQVCILLIRDGKLLGSKSFAPVKTKADLPEILSSAIRQYYEKTDPPEEILLPVELPDEALLADWLSDRKGGKVILGVPKRGTKKAVLNMAATNARELFALAGKKEDRKAEALGVLREKLSLSVVPRRMECFDMSNIGGQDAVGVMVAFQDGEPDKTGYRRFRIRTVKEPDDYAMMREVLTRRLSGGVPLPDLLVVDGGKGQLNVALSVLKDLNIKLDVIGLAKEERFFFAAKRGRGGDPKRLEDRVYLPHRKDAVHLSSFPAALAVLQRLRDEAHRFALTYHRKIKTKGDLRSILDDIPDIGPERKTMVLKHFKSIAQVRQASTDDLQKVPGIGKELAEKIYQAFRTAE